MNKIFDWHRCNRFIFVLSVPLRIDSNLIMRLYAGRVSQILQFRLSLDSGIKTTFIPGSRDVLLYINNNM